MGLQDLISLVKFCILDDALINGKPLEDCIGNVTKTVTYNGTSTVVETTIDDSDISYYQKGKSSSVYA